MMETVARGQPGEEDPAALGDPVVSGSGKFPLGTVQKHSTVNTFKNNSE